eukprot:UN07625
MVNNGKDKSNLKYSTNCSYYMKLKNQKIYNFSSIFELEIIETLSQKNDFISPTIYFEVNSVDYWNRHRIEGYGSVNIELDAKNNKEICIPIWRPIGTIRDEMRRFYIGGGIRLKDKKSISISPTTKFLNARLHWNTIQTGNIYINMNIISTYNQTDIKKHKHINSPINEPQTRRMKTKLSKLIKMDQDVSQPNLPKPARPTHHKRKKTSKLLQKMHLSD